MVRMHSVLVATGALGLVVVLTSAGGCGGSKSDLGPASDGTVAKGPDAGDVFGTVGDDAGAMRGSSSGFVSTNGSPAAPCAAGSLACLVPANCTTSVSGTVYDPAGANPLYNVVVYIPNDPNGKLPPIKQGTNSCSSCDVSIGDYVVATTSGADGKFTLTGVPAASHVPLVVQIGKWRREVFLPSIKACTDNPIPGSSMTRLPARQSEGDIPHMALVTGGADNLGCFLKGVGLDPKEYSSPGGSGKLDIYQGLPASQVQTPFPGFTITTSGAPGLSSGTAGDCTTDNPKCVWNSKANLEKYDIVLLACEGDTFDPQDAEFGAGGGGGGGGSNKTQSAKQALHDWLDEGGKVFATHFHYTWFKNSPQADFRGIATWLGRSVGQDQGPYDIDQTFPKGKVFDQWLGTVGALSGTKITLDSVAESVGTVNATAQRWIYNSAGDPQMNGRTNDTKYLSVVTPIGGISTKAADAGEGNKQYCGKAVFSDLHAGGSPGTDIPAACPGPPLSPQLKALEFLFFDLSACVSVESLPPPPPPLPAK